MRPYARPCDNLRIERFPVVSRIAERARRLQTVQHVFAALALANAGWQHLHHARGVVLPSLEIAAAALLVGAAVRERLKPRPSRARRSGTICRF